MGRGKLASKASAYDSKMDVRWRETVRHNSKDCEPLPRNTLKVRGHHAVLQVLSSATSSPHAEFRYRMDPRTRYSSATPLLSHRFHQLNSRLAATNKRVVYGKQMSKIAYSPTTTGNQGTQVIKKSKIQRAQYARRASMCAFAG